MDIRAKIEAIKEELNITTDAELAAILKVTRSTIPVWVNRGSFPKDIYYKLKKVGIIVDAETRIVETVVKKSDSVTPKPTEKTPQNQNNVEFINFQIPKDTIMIPEYGSPVHAGSPALAYNDLVGMVNATRHLHALSYYVRVKGRSMEGRNIKEGQRLLVDGSMEPRNGHLVVALVNGEYTVKVLKENGGQWLLNPDPDPDNREEFHPIRYDDSDGKMKIIGVVVRAEQDFV